MSLEFDRKLGPEFLKAVPLLSGVYLFRNAEGEVIYVGKAKNLRRRLSQYRLASARKATRKMRLIVRQAATLEVQICATEPAALLLENELILRYAPVLNVAGAYSFLYPYLGIKSDRDRPHLLTLCYTTSPEALIALGFELFGAFRSRAAAKGAYDALAFLLAFLGHPTPAERKQYGTIPYTCIISFRQLADGWATALEGYLRGESALCLDRLVEELLEKPDARQKAVDVQAHLKALKYFFDTEAGRLRRALRQLGIESSMIAQSERDRLFLSLGA